MAKYGYYEKKGAISKRLNRAAGQINGINRMVEADAYCIDILTQIGAVQAALDKVGIELLRDHANHCMANANDHKTRAEKADELVDAVARMLK